jgi:hypothetical protein
MNVKTRSSAVFEEKKQTAEDIYFAQREREVIAKLH